MWRFLSLVALGMPGATHISVEALREISSDFPDFPLQRDSIGVYWHQPVREREKGQTMLNDLNDEQTIIVYNTRLDEGKRCLYEGKVGDMSDEIRSRLRMADFYLLDSCEECDIIAVI